MGTHESITKEFWACGCTEYMMMQFHVIFFIATRSCCMRIKPFITRQCCYGNIIRSASGVGSMFPSYNTQKFIVPKKFHKSIVNDNHVNEVSMVENNKKRDKTYHMLFDVLLLIIINNILQLHNSHIFIFNITKYI